MGTPAFCLFGCYGQRKHFSPEYEQLQADESTDSGLSTCEVALTHSYLLSTMFSILTDSDAAIVEKQGD